ncbi:MAG: nickel pincer cofactor biosynthesis protein LarC [Dehalococcoidia bacterium]|nr:nickel pincer cofactor biosynthesis protein LarC [Dehalococcoidia bacterium]
MRIAYFHGSSGASGDMLLGALVDAGAPLERLQAAIDCLGEDAPTLEEQQVDRGGMRSTKVDVLLSKPIPRSEGHSSPRPLRELLDRVENSTLPNQVKTDSLHILNRIGEAEARVHGVPTDELALHELGSDDTLADIIGTVSALVELGIEHVFSAPLHIGSGVVRSQHGTLPVPVPGVTELVKGSGAQIISPPTSARDVGELLTPTGAALLTTIATFEAPTMSIDAVGYGAGGRNPDERPNVLTLWIGDADTATKAASNMIVIETNIDDMNPELFGYAREALSAAGARDVWLSSIQMKKDRPGTLLSAITPADRERQVVDALLKETSTLGVRVTPVRRWEADRTSETVDTRLGPIRVKLKVLDGRPVSVAPEYDDCRDIARRTRMPILEVMRVAQRAADDRFL